MVSQTKSLHCFLGIDLGSAYTKFTVIDENENVAFQSIIQTLSREGIKLKDVINTIHDKFTIKFCCATGYGRKYFPDADIIKTEISCAATGVSKYKPGGKSIIDIGGEDIKIIRCDEQNKVESFYLNDKCAAGTGSFITEISEKAGIKIPEMSGMASKSDFKKELNSFCTVFAKTEIMGWLFEGRSIEDISKGIYISIANRVSKLRIDLSVPVYLIGGVIAHHPYLNTLLEEKIKQQIFIIENPQYVIAYGAALIAKTVYHAG